MNIKYSLGCSALSAQCATIFSSLERDLRVIQHPMLKIMAAVSPDGSIKVPISTHWQFLMGLALAYQYINT